MLFMFKRNPPASLGMLRCPTSSQTQPGSSRTAHSDPAVALHGRCIPAGTPATSPDTCSSTQIPQTYRPKHAKYNIK